MKKDWRIYALRGDFDSLAQRFGIDPVVARVIRNRGITTPEEYENYLFGTLDSVNPPETMLDIELGADIIADSIEEGKKIRVVGDYDVDGVMSTYILYDALKKLGADVSYDIPHRVRDGYGMNVRIVDDAHNDGVETIITCDNGISAVTAVEKAIEYGITVVITDHHEIPPELPEADAIIDPHQTGDGYPYKDICGAVVAYKFIQVLYKRLGRELEKDAYIEAVAAATVCDVMPLLNENRIYVREGLRRLEKTEHIGLKALIKACGIDNKTLTGYHLGFILGPCVNAMGKLGDAKDALELMITDDPVFAEERAELLHETNESRKAETAEGEEKAVSQLAENMKIVNGESVPKDDVIIVYIPELKEGLAGIVAGRLRERYYRPTIVFTDTDGDKSIIKGSGRSIEAYNMFEKIDCHRDMCIKFGGHPLAAGLSIKREDFEEFRRLLNEDAGLTEADLVPKMMIDVPMPMRYASLRLAEQLESLGPFGNGNEEPLFAEAGMEILGYFIGGKNNNFLKVKVRSSKGEVHEVKYFRPQEFEECINRWFTPEECDKMKKGVSTGCKIDIAYTLSVNDFRNVKECDLLIKAYDKS